MGVHGQVKKNMCFLREKRRNIIFREKKQQESSSQKNDPNHRLVSELFGWIPRILGKIHTFFWESTATGRLHQVSGVSCLQDKNI